jgi:anhydro-N-acetylmuramic acid kinase
MDALIRSIDNQKHFDENAQLALQGTCNNDLLTALQQNDFFEKEFPKTTGPELFNLSYLLQAQQTSNTTKLTNADVMNTLNAFSVWCITEAIKKTNLTESTIYVSGGGMHNPLLMERIKKGLENAVVKTTDELEINPDAKEAVLFALLANECLAGKRYEFGNAAKGIPEISMGKISLPG